MSSWRQAGERARLLADGAVSSTVNGRRGNEAASKKVVLEKDDALSGQAVKRAADRGFGEKKGHRK